jgi:chaperonin cofactor prefoldin
MKTNLFKLLLIVGLLFIVSSLNRSYCQDSLSQRSQMLDLKLQLLDSKLELLDAKIKLWEAKPKELDIKLSELGNKINAMDFEPQMVTKKFKEIDSLLKSERSLSVMLIFSLR